MGPSARLHIGSRKVRAASTQFELHWEDSDGGTCTAYYKVLTPPRDCPAWWPEAIRSSLRGLPCWTSGWPTSVATSLCKRLAFWRLIRRSLSSSPWRFRVLLLASICGRFGGVVGGGRRPPRGVGRHTAPEVPFGVIAPTSAYGLISTARGCHEDPMPDYLRCRACDVSPVRPTSLPNSWDRIPMRLAGPTAESYRFSRQPRYPSGSV